MRAVPHRIYPRQMQVFLWILAILLLGASQLFAIPAFPNADFETGTFANWPVHEGWSLQGGLDTVIDDQTLPELTGYFSACSRNPVEQLSTNYTGKNITVYPKRLVSAPFVVQKPYMTLLLTGSPTGGNNMLGMDFNQDGIPEVRFTEEALAALRKGCPDAGIVSLDLREYQGKTGVFMATVTGGNYSLDRLLLDDHPALLISNVTMRQEGTNGRVQCQVTNPYNALSTAELRVTVLDYYGKQVAETTQPIHAGAQETITTTTTFPITLGPEYRITAKLLTADDIPLQFKRLRYRPERLQATRPILLIDDGWEVTTSTDTQLALPPGFATWKAESPVKPSGTFGYRSGEWKKYQDQAQVWYRRSFSYPSRDLGNAGVVLRLDGGGDGLFTVFVNGRTIDTRNIYRYSEETFDLTPALEQGQNELIIRFRNPDRYQRNKDDSFTLVPIREYWGIPTGLFGHVYLEGRSPVHASAVLIDPSVSKGTLMLRITVDNTGNAPATATIGAGVFTADGKEVLTCKNTTATINDGQQTEVTITQPWNEPILWSTETPNLLRLRVTVTNKNNIDRTDTRFGFREFTIDGKDFLLNGHPLNIFDSTGIGPEAFHHHKTVYGENSNRSPYISFDSLAVGDEEGMLSRMTMETLYPPKINEITPEYWQRFEEQQAVQLRYTYNSPALWGWVVGNELGGAGYLRVPYVETFRPLFDHLIKKLQAIDPMRPVMSDGDMDYFGSSPVWNLHYPFEYGQSYALPNKAYFVAPGVQLMDWFPHPTYEGSKPIFLGEAFSGGNMGPDWLAPFGGDWVYEPIGLFDTWKEWVNLRMRAYRDQHIFGYEPFEPFDYVRDFLPIDLYPKEYNHHFFGGTKLTRTIQVFNSIQSTQTLTLHWQLDGIAQGDIPLTLAPGETREAPVTIDLPVVEQRKDATFSLVLLKDGSPIPRCGRWERTYSIFPKTQLTGTIAVSDLDDQTLTMLRDAGLTVTPVTTAAALTPHRLLITSGALLRDDLNGVLAWVRNGGHVLLLGQRESIDGVPLLLNKFSDTRAHSIAPGNPLVAGLQSDDLYYWGTDNYITRYSYTKPTQGDFQVLYETGDEQGLRMTPLVAYYEGKGSFIGCSLLLAEKYQEEPVVGLLLGNILKQANAPSTTQRVKTGVLASDQLTAYLRRQGWTLDDLAGIANPTLSTYQLLWVDAGLATVNVTALKSFVEGGGTLVLSRLDPTVVESFKPLIPFDFTLKKTPRDQAYGGEMKRVGLPELLQGISNYDLYWKRGSFPRGGPSMRMTSVPVEFAVAPDAAATVTMLADPGALLETSVGKGRLIINQIRWEESFEKENRSPRVFNTLLHNLRVARGDAAMQESTAITKVVPIPANRPLRTGLLDGITGKVAQFPTGEVTLGGVAFRLPPAGANTALLGATKGLPGIPTRLTIPVNGTADRLWFWHSCAFGFIDHDDNKTVWEYRISLRDGAKQYTEVVPVRYGRDVYEYLGAQPATLDNATQVTVSDQVGLSSYIMAWSNPHPTATIERIEMVGTNEKIAPILLGITLLKNQEAVQTTSRRRTGLWSASEQRYTEISDVGRVWAIIGPFENAPRPRGGYDAVYPPETDIDLNAKYEGKQKVEVGWQKHVQPILKQARTSDSITFEDFDLLPFKTDIHKEFWTSYAYTKINSPIDQPIIIAFGSDDGAKMWVNGNLVFDKWAQRTAELGQELIPVVLKQGWNTVLVKVVDCAGTGGFAFDLKTYDPAVIAAWQRDWRTLAPRPSLPLECDAFAGSTVSTTGDITVSQVLTADLDGKADILEGTCSNAGALTVADAFYLYYPKGPGAGLSVAIPQKGAKLTEGKLSLQFLIPPGGAPPDFSIAGRNAGGSNMGDIIVRFVGGKPSRVYGGTDDAGKPSDTLHIDLDRMQNNPPITRKLDRGLPEGVWNTLVFTWGNHPGRAGFRVILNGQEMLSLPEYTGPAFNATTPLGLAADHRKYGQGALAIRNVVFQDYLAP